MMTTNSYPKLLDILPIGTHSDFDIGVHVLNARTAHSSTPRLLNAHQRTFLDTRSKAFVGRQRQGKVACLQQCASSVVGV